MTFSDAWIESVDDPDYDAFIEQSPPRFGVLPPPARPYWINHMREWAAREQLPLVHGPYGKVGIAVSKAQLLCFLAETLGEPSGSADRTTLRGYIERKCRDDRTYVIASEEF